VNNGEKGNNVRICAAPYVSVRIAR
jgi:hypothetical protein